MNEVNNRPARDVAAGVQEGLRDQLFSEIDLNGAIRVEESQVQFENNSVKDTELRNVKPGSGSVTFANGEFEISTGANGTDAQALETARLGKYNAGLPAAIGILVQKDSNPTGFAEWGYGGDAFSNELRWHLESDGSYRFDRVRAGVETNIPRNLWEESAGVSEITDNNGNTTGEVIGNDPLDGTGESGIEIEPPFIGLFGIDFVLYGGGGFAPWIVDLAGNEIIEKTYAFVFHPLRETVITKFNVPIFGRLDNDGTATADSLTIAERQFSVFGTPQTSPRDTPHVFDLTKTVDSPTCLFGIRRESAGSPVPLNLDKVNVSVDNDAHVYYLIDPTITGGDTAANWVRPDYDYASNSISAAETTLEINESLTVDATTGVPISGGVALSGQGSNVVSTDFADLDNSLFIRDRPVALMMEPRAGGNNVTSQEGVQTVTEDF